MSKTSRIIFLLVGCIFPIFIGVLHTATHLTQLVTPEIQDFLQKEFVILGKSQCLWNTWGIVSFMMGASFIVMGLLNIETFRKLSKTDFPPTLTLVALLIFQLCVIYVGQKFEQSFQFFGGIFGGVLLLISLLFTLNQKNKST